MDFPRLRAFAQTVEGLGFDLVTIPDHIVHEGIDGNYNPKALSFDPMVVAAVIAEATKRIRIGQLVLCNLFRHPAITAMSLATLDQMSGGRVTAGLGTGWCETEFKMTGIAFPPIRERLKMLDESLTCMRSLWTKEETTFAGEYYNLHDAILWPKPVQRPHPPILLGGNGNGLLRIAAKHASYINIVASNGRQGRLTSVEVGKLNDDAFVERVRFLREETRRAGRDPRAIKISAFAYFTTITDSPAETRRAAQKVADMHHTTVEAALRFPRVLIGTPEECAAELLRRAREWEIEQFIFGATDDATLRRLAEQVIPQVRAN
jgi:probable F420-dependent oxidoreductase